MQLLQNQLLFRNAGLGHLHHKYTPRVGDAVAPPLYLLAIS